MSPQQPRSRYHKKAPQYNDNASQDNNNGIMDEAQADDDEYGRLVSPPTKNRCTILVASIFLVLVVVALIVTWVVFPTEEIVVKFLPKFDAPASPYTGPEPGSDATDTNNSGQEGEIGTAFDNEEPIDDGYTSIPSFMTCPSSSSELCCNGSTLNCQLKVNEMMFGTLHNAMAAEEGGFTFGYNHYLSLEKAMVAGYRGINLDLCNCADGGLQFCHNVCNFGQRDPYEVFTNVLYFLNEYPSEVFIFIFQADESEKLPIVWNDLFDVMKQVDGFVDMMYVHDGGNEWPLMSALVKNNKRIITFYFNGGSCTNDACPESFLPFYNYTAETEFQSENLDALRDITYSCQLTRGPGGFSGDFFAVNNFVTPPDPEVSKITNGQDFLSERLTKCANYNGKRPNFVYIDFWSEGVTAQFAQSVNKQMATQKQKQTKQK